MTALGALALLLMVSYVGGVLVGGQRLPGRGLASGAEWLVAGFLAGPVLGVVGPETLDLFGELLGPASLRWVLRRAGEIPERSDASAPLVEAARWSTWSSSGWPGLS